MMHKSGDVGVQPWGCRAEPSTFFFHMQVIRLRRGNFCGEAEYVHMAHAQRLFHQRLISRGGTSTLRKQPLCLPNVANTMSNGYLARLGLALDLHTKYGRIRRRLAPEWHHHRLRRTNGGMSLALVRGSWRQGCEAVANHQGKGRRCPAGTSWYALSQPIFQPRFHVAVARCYSLLLLDTKKFNGPCSPFAQGRG